METLALVGTILNWLHKGALAIVAVAVVKEGWRYVQDYKDSVHDEKMRGDI